MFPEANSVVMISEMSGKSSSTCCSGMCSFFCDGCCSGFWLSERESVSETLFLVRISVNFLLSWRVLMSLFLILITSFWMVVSIILLSFFVLIFIFPPLFLMMSSCPSFAI
jgi:hypothetical protein